MTLTDPRLRQAADLIEAVLRDTIDSASPGYPDPEAVYRLSTAHDAVTQADRLLTPLAGS